MTKAPKPPVYIHREAVPGKCRICKAPRLAGMDEAVMAARVVVDAEPLGRPGEPGVLLRAVVAHLSGLAVVEIGELSAKLTRVESERLAWLGRQTDRRLPRLLVEHRCPVDAPPAAATG